MLRWNIPAGARTIERFALTYVDISSEDLRWVTAHCSVVLIIDGREYLRSSLDLCCEKYRPFHFEWSLHCKLQGTEHTAAVRIESDDLNRVTTTGFTMEAELTILKEM